MPSDPNKPLLKLDPQADQPRAKGPPRPIPRPQFFHRDRQNTLFGPKFNRLAAVLARGDGALQLRADPMGLAPERLLVFEVRGAVSTFAAAVRRIAGLELIDEEEMEGDEDDQHPIAYLLVPDVAALRNLESLWRRWQQGRLVRGETPWANVFALLRDLRPWGPTDRIQRGDLGFLTAEIEGRGDNDLIRLEVEIVFRANDVSARESEETVRGEIEARGGRIVSRARIPDISYHALLADIPVWAVRQIVEHHPQGIASLDPILHIRPQSEATTIEIGDAVQPDPDQIDHGPLGEPILALLDGVPVAAHRLLAEHIRIDDAFDLEPNALVASRAHGTAMASLIVHGDRNRSEAPLPRQIFMLPVMGNNDAFPTDRLVIDLIYLAVMRLRQQHPSIVIVNLSLGNSRRPFHGQISPWARLLDRLAHRLGLLFIVSAGNKLDEFGMAEYPTSVAYDAADGKHRAKSIITALNNVVAERRLFSPAETVNGVTVGASNEDAVTPADRRLARVFIDPFPDNVAANPSSTVGPGYARSVKPDILMPGAREHMQVVRNHVHIEIRPGTASRGRGTKGSRSASWRPRESRGLHQRNKRCRRLSIAYLPSHSRRA